MRFAKPYANYAFSTPRGYLSPDSVRKNIEALAHRIASAKRRLAIHAYSWSSYSKQ